MSNHCPEAQKLMCEVLLKQSIHDSAHRLVDAATKQVQITIADPSDAHHHTL